MRNFFKRLSRLASSNAEARSAMQNIWFILGRSGSGKTYFANYLSKKHYWLHLDIDQLYIIGKNTYGDGIDTYRLRQVWSYFAVNKITGPLVEAITEQYRDAGRSGAVLSFPSNYIIEIEDIKELEKDIRVVYLSGNKEGCLKSFLLRETKKSMVPTGKDKTVHWEEYNADLANYLSMPLLRPYKIEVFYDNGVRKPPGKIYDEINCLD
ncbi:MAG TPA: hypothetical protein VN316_02090 [candidate division Zixibacteria bacterium]|nr:hypothetical protein [candidate division Zixibacteria bacterium]